MSQTQLVSPNTIAGYIRCISGLFVTKEYPHGIPPVEMEILAVLFTVLKTNNKTEIDKDVQIEVANKSNMSLQVVLNYLTRLRKKGVIQDKKLHHIFYKKEILIKNNF